MKLTRRQIHRYKTRRAEKWQKEAELEAGLPVFDLSSLLLDYDIDTAERIYN